MQKNDVSMDKEIPYKLYNADSGGLKFVLKPNLHLENHNHQPIIHLIAKNCPHDELYEITFAYDKNTIYIRTAENVVTSIPLPIEFRVLSEIDLWMSWHHQEICLGLVNNKSFFIYPRNITGGNSAKEFIGYIKLETNYGFQWIVEEPPQVYSSPPSKDDIKGGKLQWVSVERDKLPLDALIGGFENNPLYVARAMHSGSLCPGKYVPLKGKAYVAWGGREHEKSDFQILCGYNAQWVKCKGANVPENVFIAGTSEIRNEPLYIGRAMIGHHLVIVPPVISRPPLNKLSGGKPQWVAASGQLPDRSLIGGYENEFLYIIRSPHNGSLTPGKFTPSLGLGFISWGGEDHEKTDFEVLSGYNCQWVRTRGDRIPVTAVEAGYTEGCLGEVLYVGWARYEGHIIPGKVQPSHGTCYIPYQGREISKTKYEILVCPFSNKHVEHNLFYSLNPEQTLDNYSEDERLD